MGVALGVAMLFLLAAAALSTISAEDQAKLDELVDAFSSRPLSLERVAPGASCAEAAALGARPAMIDLDGIDGDRMLVLRRDNDPRTDAWITMDGGEVRHVSKLVFGRSTLFDQIRTALIATFGEPSPASYDAATQTALVPDFPASDVVDGWRWTRADGTIDLFRFRPGVTYVAVSLPPEPALEAEIRSALNTLWVAERAFREEYPVYSNDLVSVNWTPRTATHAVYGFCTPPQRLEGINLLDPPRATTPQASVPDLGDACAVLRRLGIGDSFGADAAHWRAFAVGRVAPGDGGLRVWTIGDDRRVERLR